MYNELLGFLSGGLLEGIEQIGTSIGTKSQNSSQEATTQAKPGTVEYVQELSDLGAEKTQKQHISMEDYANSQSPVWQNVEYDDVETKNSIMREVHDAMVSEGSVVKVSDSVVNKVDKAFPDLRAVKKKDRTPIIKSTMNKLKDELRHFLDGFKAQSFEFEVNGKVLDAKLYNTGINEVLEKVTQKKANMLYSTGDIFRNAQYLYSTPDYDGDPNVYRWNYFYTPVQMGDEIVGVRIAVRDVAEGQNHLPESQIYNWGIKKDAPLGGVQPVVSNSSHGASSDAFNNSISETEPGVNRNSDGSSIDALSYIQELAALGQGKETVPTVDTESQAGYDNENNQGGVVDGTERATQAYDDRGTETDAPANQGTARATDAGRSEIPGNVGEKGTKSSEVHFPGGQHRGLTEAGDDFNTNDYLVPDEDSSLRQVQRTFQDSGIECRIVKASAWTRSAPAYAHNGKVYISESIDPATLSTAPPHETTHVMKQKGFQAYLDFANRTPDMLPMQNETTWELLSMAAKHRGVDVFEMSDADLINLYDEINAIVYGMYKSGVLNDSRYGYEWVTDAFSDFDKYIKELDGIHEQYRQQVKIGKTETEGKAYVSVDTTTRVPNESVGAASAGFDPNTHLQYQYGTLPEGENAVRSDDLPVSTDGNNRVSQTAVTVKGAKVTPDEFADLLTKDVTEKNGMTYIPITNDATVQKAMDHISNEGWEAAKAQWQAVTLHLSRKTRCVKNTSGYLFIK